MEFPTDKLTKGSTNASPLDFKNSLAKLSASEVDWISYQMASTKGLTNNSESYDLISDLVES
jgi:hypothetical protein